MKNARPDLIHIFLETEFAGGRHARRIAKIAQLEKCTAAAT